MEIGEVVITTHITKIIENAQLGYKAEKGRQFVFIFLGDEPRDGSDNLDPIKRLNDLGWELREKME